MYCSDVIDREIKENQISVFSKEQNLYLDLLAKCLTRNIFSDCYTDIPRNTKTVWRQIRWSVYNKVQRLLSQMNFKLVHTKRPAGETMIGPVGLQNLKKCVDEVLAGDVPGDFCETGVWRGGACIFMSAMLKMRGDTTRKVWACDSFEGIPKPNSEMYPADKESSLWELSLAVSLEEVKENFMKYNLLDDRVKFLKGYFSDTIHSAPIDKLAILRLDGDMYESTMVVLQNLYHKLSIGGYVIIDDYEMIPECNLAVEDFRREQGIDEKLEFMGYVNGKPLGAFWKKRS